MHDQAITLNSQPATASLLRRTWPVALLGVFGVLSMLLQPVPAGVLERAPVLAALPPLALGAVLLINPMILVLLATLVGGALAHRVGLGSVLGGTAPVDGWQGSLVQAAGWGMATGFMLAAIDTVITPFLGSAWQTLIAGSPTGLVPLAIGILYGGLAEEVMLRWGVMSLAAWCAVSLLGRQRSRPAMVLAIIAAAGLFAAAHLPAVASQAELTPAIVLRTLGLNGIAGLLYGWLFWRRHLEAAMAAHAATHLGLAAWRMTLG